MITIALGSLQVVDMDRSKYREYERLMRDGVLIERVKVSRNEGWVSVDGKVNYNIKFVSAE